MKDINTSIADYKRQLNTSDIQKTYKFLFDYLGHLKAYLSKNNLKDYTFGYIAPGYMDYTYFSFYNEYLRDEKLRFGLVLNHKEMQFELWVMGQNAEIQNRYWDKLKDSDWNKERKQMPKYSFLEVTITNSPDFGDLENLTKIIAENINFEICSILTELEKL